MSFGVAPVKNVDGESTEGGFGELSCRPGCKLVCRVECLCKLVLHTENALEHRRYIDLPLKMVR